MGPKIIYKPKCGRRNGAGVGARIQGFTQGESQFGEWPHMCAVLHDKKLDNGESANLYKCGGSLIAEGVILTAAHCIQDFKPYPNELKVRCGEWDTQHKSEPYGHQDRQGADIKIHPEFNPRNLANDFALIFLAEDFLDFHVDTVCLPEPNQAYGNYAPCYATGWGRDRFGSKGDYQVVLKEVDLNVVDNAQCQSALRTTRLGKKFKLHPSLCVLGAKERILAPETEAVRWCVLQAMILTPMNKLALSPGVLDAEKKESLEFTLLSARQYAGLTMP